MTQISGLANLSIAGISGIVVLIIIIVVVIWIVRRSDNGSRSNSSASSDRRGGRRRFRVEAAGDEQQEERFEVAHGRRKHHHRRKSTSSSSSSSSSSSKSKSSDDSCFRSGGLGDVCLIDATGNTCSSGLACVGGRCVCPRPAVPVVTAITQGGNTIVADWAPVPGADFYQVILYRVLGPNQFDPIDVATLRGLTAITFGGLVPGNYSVEVRAGSDACGIVSGTIAGIANITLGTPCTPGGPACPAGTVCQGGFCVPIATLTGQGIAQVCLNNANCAQGLLCQNGACVCPAPPAVVGPVTLTVGPTPTTIVVTWPRVVGADIYQVRLFVPNTNISQTRLVTTPPGPPTPTISTTFTGLERGRSYLAEVTTGSNACGISALSPATVSNPFTLPCGPLPATVNFNTLTSVPGPIVGTTRTVTYTWTAVPGADRYFVVIQDTDTTGAPVFFGEVAAPTVTATLEIGELYEVFIYSVSNDCGRNPVPLVFESSVTA